MLVLRRTKSNQLLYMQALLRRLHEHDLSFLRIVYYPLITQKNGLPTIVGSPFSFILF